MLRRLIVASISAGVFSLIFHGSAAARDRVIQSGKIWESGPFALSVGIGPIWGNYKGSYSSTGGQAPGSGSDDGDGAAFQGGFTAYWPIGNNPNGIKVGGGLNIAGQTTGKVNTFHLLRHGATGYVDGFVDPGARFEAFVGVHIPVPQDARQPVQIDYVLFRMGPVFARNEFSITSNQVPGGGVFEQASVSHWSTGFSVSGGLAFNVCKGCFAGAPLTGTIIGKGAWFNQSHSVAVTSSTFGFVETATFDGFSEYSVLFGLSAPIGVAGPRY